MKIPTTEQIEAILRSASQRKLTIQDTAGVLMSLIEPQYKPLSELYLDRGSCNKIFSFMTHGGQLHDILIGKDYISLVGMDTDMTPNLTHIDIWEGGSIIYTFKSSGKEMEANIENIFEVVDYIRELGYSVK
jgi:hypothetical protein